MSYGLIYILVDPRDRKLRYVGQTTQTLSQRLAAHISPSMCRVHSYLGRWMSGLKLEWHRPIIIPIAVAQSKQELDDLEVAFIRELRACGAELVNLAPGGAGAGKGHVVTPQTRAKIAAKQLGIPKPKHTEQWKRDMSAMMKGRASPNTPEHHAHLVEMKRGVPRSPEVRAKISAAKIGVPQSPASNEKRRAANIATNAAARLPHASGEASPRHNGVSSEAIFRLRAIGFSQRQIAEAFGISQPCVQQRLKKASP